MMTKQDHDTGRRLAGWRIAGWSAIAALLALPAIAMRFTDEVQWTAGDFLFAAILLIALGIGLEVSVRLARSRAHMAGLAIAALTGFLTMWANAAVGFIGSEDAPVNTGFFLLVVLALIASLIARLRPAPMRWITGIVAVGQIALGLLALATMPGHAVEWGVLAFFALLWGSASFCFARAART